MKTKIILFHFFLAVIVNLHLSKQASSQPARAALKDSLSSVSIPATDSAAVKADSTILKDFLLTQSILQKHPYYNFSTAPQPISYTIKKKVPGKELYFYMLAGLLLVFAGFRTTFDKYFNDLMTIFFKRSLKQRQLKQQVSQHSLPSLLFNILYILSASFYLALLVKEFSRPGYLFWQIFGYSAALISVVYLIKYALLKLTGWMFQLRSTVDSYIFIVFLVNKMIGIFLLPVIVLVALGNIHLKTAALTLSWVLLSGLFIYRFVQAFGLLRKQKNISVFHFVLYLLAFEVLPLLVIYKAISHLL